MVHFIHVYFTPSGYARILLALTSFFFMLTNPVVVGILYSLSYLLDYFDGWAARKFNQATTFGGVLDLVIDELSHLHVVTLGIWPNMHESLTIACTYALQAYTAVVQESTCILYMYTTSGDVDKQRICMSLFITLYSEYD